MKKVRGVDFDPNIGFKNGTRTIWNKGLTKDTDPRVKKFSDTLSDKYATKGHPWQGRKHTNESKEKMSLLKKELYNKFPEKHPNRKLAGNFNKMTYPEKLVYKYLDSIGVECKHNEKVLSYYPDFIVFKNIIIEVDGSHWHDSNDSNQIKRDTELKEAGFKVHRIPAKNVIKNLKEVLKNYRGMVQW